MTAATHQANHLAGSKTASRIFFADPPKVRPVLPSQVTETHLESVTYVYRNAPGCVVAPNSTDDYLDAIYRGEVILGRRPLTDEDIWRDPSLLGEAAWNQSARRMREASDDMMDASPMGPFMDATQLATGRDLEGNRISRAEKGLKVAINAAGAKILAVLGTMTGAAGEILSRLGSSKESVGRLTRKAAEAEEKLGIHGVSTSAAPATGEASSAARSAIEQHFPVHNTPTRADPLHRTVELPKPVTQKAADIFNSIFGR